MVNIYLRDDIELKLLEMAKTENKVLIDTGKKPNISKSTIIQRIVYTYFEEDAE